MKPISPFDAEADCELLRKAMRGAGMATILHKYILLFVSYLLVTFVVIVYIFLFQFLCFLMQIGAVKNVKATHMYPNPILRSSLNVNNNDNKLMLSTPRGHTQGVLPWRARVMKLYSTYLNFKPKMK